MSKEAMKLALEALENAEYGDYDKTELNKAIISLRKELARQESTAWVTAGPHTVPLVTQPAQQEPVAYSYTSRITGAQGFSHHPMPRFVDSESWDIKPLYTQQYTYIAPTHQKPFGWKLVPIEPTNEMLKAMDECSTEGYDERLLAGHASSVYMAAVDVAPTPPDKLLAEGDFSQSPALPHILKALRKQRTWHGLTNEEMHECWGDPLTPLGMKHARKIEAKLKQKNGYVKEKNT